MPRKPKSVPKPAETPPEPQPENLSAMLEKAKGAVERGVAMLDACIKQVSEMLKSGEYDSKLASHLAWVLDKQANAMADLRRFGEKVKTQSLELTPEQRLRAVAKVIQTLPVTQRENFKRIIDEPISDIELVA